MGPIAPDLLEDVATSTDVKSWQLKELVDQLRSGLEFVGFRFLVFWQPLEPASDVASAQVPTGDYSGVSADDQHLDRIASEGMTVDPATLSCSA